MADVVWRNLRGMNRADPPTRVPEAMAVDAAGVLLEGDSLGRRRPSLATIAQAGTPPGNGVYGLVRYQPNEKFSGGLLAAMTAGGGNLHVFDGATWTSVTMTDTPSGMAADVPHAATHNGKLFVAYNSAVNRLHVYDPAFSSATVRRVGIAASAAATVANTGAGSYAATLRYYKIQWKLITGSNTIATSELSPSVSFTPSGAGTHARVTKPTTPDSATHWIVFGSTDNVTFYNVSGNIAVGTTTYDDSATPANYANGAVAPTAGLSVPPPSCKYLLSDGNRLLMAGAWETSAATTETAPLNSRVWFTAVNGARDNTGEDESVPQTVDQKFWIDCGENDGDGILGLGGPIEGQVYAFKQRSIWRLTPTGDPTTPYRAERITDTMGATSQNAIAMGEDGIGRPAMYFMSLLGPKRITVEGLIEDLGADLRDTTSATWSVIPSAVVLVWDQVRRVLWWIAQSGSSYAFQPQFEQRTSQEGTRGGWTRHAGFIFADVVPRCAAVYGDPLVPVVGGTDGGIINPVYLYQVSGNQAADFGSQAIDASITSPVFQPGTHRRRCSVARPVLEWEYPGAATAIGVSLISAISGPTNVVGTLTDTTTASTYTTTTVQETLESLQWSDIQGFQVKVTWDTAVNGTVRPRMVAVYVPVQLQEPT